MIRLNFVSLCIAFSMFTASISTTYAQETTSLQASERNLRAQVEEALPAWWHLEAFEITEFGGPELAVAPSGKGPGMDPNAPLAPLAPGGGLGVKPEGSRIAPAAIEQVVAFSAQLELRQRIYEALYSADGAAFVTEIMGPGLGLEVTGTIGVSGTGDDATFSAVLMDQGGLEDLGKPLDGFGLPAYIIGSEEAEAFMAERDAARIEGTINKLMSDEGDEL